MKIKSNTVSIAKAIAAGADPTKLGVTLVKLVRPNGAEEKVWVDSKSTVVLFLTNTVMVAAVDGMRIPCVSISTSLPMRTHRCAGRYRNVVEVESYDGDEVDLDVLFDAAMFYGKRAEFVRELKRRREKTLNPKRLNPIALAKARKEKRRRQDAHEVAAFAAWCCGGSTFEADCYVARVIDTIYRKGLPPTPVFADPDDLP